MKFNFDNCGFNGVDVMFSVPKGEEGLEVHSRGTTFNDLGKMLEVRDPPSVYQTLGLPADTPPEVLIEALTLLSAVKDRPIEEQKEALRGSRLVSLLGVGANVATILSALAPLLSA